MSTKTQRPPRAATGLVLKRRHSAPLAQFARLLNVPPQTFIDWQLDDMVNGFDEPDGWLYSWVMDGLLQWDSPEEQETVRQRYAAWLKSKGASRKRIACLTAPPLTEEQRKRVVATIVGAKEVSAS